MTPTCRYRHADLYCATSLTIHPQTLSRMSEGIDIDVIEARIAELTKQGIVETAEERMRFSQGLFGHVPSAQD